MTSYPAGRSILGARAKVAFGAIAPEAMARPERPLWTRFETLPRQAARSPTCGLAQIPSADLDIPVPGQLAPAQLPLSDALEPRSLKVVRLDAPLIGGPLRE